MTNWTIYTISVSKNDGKRIREQRHDFTEEEWTAMPQGMLGSLYLPALIMTLESGSKWAELNKPKE